ncbi:MAG: hypothetical protein J0I09_08070 [Sphingobacteriia bacterium]|nr:hypothetical protein [Sphingobacteriia bacterium]
MLYQDIISAVGLIGVGAILKSIIDLRLKKREVQNQAQHEFKDKRYKVIVLLAYSMLDFDKNKAELHKHSRMFETSEQLLDELKVERTNMILFASDKVILAINQFILSPDEDNFHILVIAMRKDLYGLNTKLNPATLKF